jgi:hypothetical protein
MKAESLKPPSETPQIVTRSRPHVSVDYGGRRPFILTKLPRHAVRERNVAIKTSVSQDLLSGKFVLGVGK